ncbi:hypothetical protein CY34DRAFT_809768 [Suillus luteus UH-Slu-Lm8-n1]|uniref:Uncharacterized protein n=1 Tax=Suillus luteus UH-Slu-Lm8-n1 TaxID=930992 RepID=A0A0D0AUP6_9AGAM|nr:hypothetical protein CY34DRAFT_809768 [Suillus luteus UH-Slu-Lm8-n1]
MACNTFRFAVWNSVDIQYKLEIYTQGLIGTETTTMNSIGVSRKMHSLKKLASLWPSDFHANTIFETVVNVVTHCSSKLRSDLIREMWALVDEPADGQILKHQCMQ